MEKIEHKWEGNDNDGEKLSLPHNIRKQPEDKLNEGNQIARISLASIAIFGIPNSFRVTCAS